MSITIKPLTQEHFQQSMDLSSFAFQFPLSSEQLDERRDSFLSDNQLKLGVFDGERLCAQATLLHFQTYIAGQPFDMGGLAGVSTWPEHRRQGFVAELLSELLLRMKQNGQSISMLHPFAFAFYRKFGWESYVDHKIIELGNEQLTGIVKNQRNEQQLGKIVRLTDWKYLQQVYNQYAIRYNGMLKRTEDWWKNVVVKKKKGIYAAYQDEQGQLQGYIIYEAINRHMNIHEFVTLTHEAEQGLLLYIAQHDSMVAKVSWIAQKDDEFVFGLGNPRVKQEVTPYFMARIVDVCGFIAQYPFTPAGYNEQYAIEIVDEQAAWNNGMFKLYIDSDGKAVISKETNATEADITISIGALTTWLLCYQTWSTLARFGKVSGKEDHLKRLQNRIQMQSTYLTDFF